MARPETEAALAAALDGRTTPLNNADVAAMCAAAGCSTATFYRTKAVKDFMGSMSEPPKRATKGTKEKMGRLRSTIKLLANCVQVLSVKVELQEEEIGRLRTRDNVVTLPVDPAARAKRLR